MAELALLVFALLQAPAGRLSLDGQVVTLGTNVPVAHARIVVSKLGGTVADYRTGVADAAGRFSIPDLTPGNYRVFTERQGYLRGEHGRRAPSGDGTPVAVLEGQRARITVAMMPTGAITGRVLDDGRPIRNVWVRVMRASFFDGRRSLAIVDYVRSNDLGEYRLFGLAPGIYYVSALPSDRPRIDGDTYVVPTIPSNANGNRSQVGTPASDALSKGLVDVEAFDSRIFLPVFFPGTTDATAATAIDVQAGITSGGIDLTIVQSRTVRVRGRVIDARTGMPPQNVLVSVAPQEGHLFTVAGDQVDAVGAFELPAVPPGKYQLIARTVTTDTRLFGIASIEVGDRDVENVDIVIRPGTTLKGRVSIVGAPTTGARPPVSVQLNGVGGMTGYSAQLQVDGTFAIENVEAREYRVRFVLRGGGFRAPTSGKFGGEDITGRTFRFGPEFADSPLELVVSLAVGGLEVSVVDGSQRAVQGVTVALVPDAPRRNQSSLFRRASSDNSGRLRFEAVAPGEYLLFTDDVDPQAWEDPEVLVRYENNGTRVRVVENTRQTITLRIR